MNLLELFNAPAKYDLVRDDEDNFTARSVINGRTIDFIGVGKNKWGTKLWQVEFQERGQNNKVRLDTTGSGGEFKVMNMVMTCLKDLVKKHSPDVIEFTAAKDRNAADSAARMLNDKDRRESARPTVYYRMIKQLLHPEYDIQTKDHGHEIVFMLSK